MANENQIKHKIVISGEQEYKRAMREMGTSLKEAKSEVKATAAEMDAQGKSVEGLTAQMKALENQRQKEADMLREMQRHLEAVVAATGEESDEAVKLRTRINAMRTEIAQTSSQMAKLTGELDEAKEAAEGLGGSGAANGIKGLGAAAESAEGDMDGILGKLSTLGQGFTIGIGANLGSGVADIIKDAVATAITEGWNDAVEHRIEYNQIGVKTGTAGTGLNDYMASQLDRLKVTNPNRNATEWIDALAAAYTNLPEGVFTNAARLNGLIARLDTVSVATGKSVPDLTDDIADLNRVFGTDFDNAAAILCWTGTGPAGQDGISALTEYATVWEKIGTDAMGAAAMLTLARISGVTNVQAVGKAAKNAGDFLGDFLGNKKAIEDLGLLAEDLGPKFKKGGEEAKAAMTLLMNTFLGLDPEKQEAYGGKIFGEDNWKHLLYGDARVLVGHDLAGERRGCAPRTEAELSNFLTDGNWALLDPESGEPVARVEFHDYRYLTVSDTERGFCAFLNFDRYDARPTEAPDMIALEYAEDFDSMWENPGYSYGDPVGEYQLHMAQLDGEQILTLTQVSDGRGILSDFCAAADEGGSFTLHRFQGTVEMEAQG